MSDYEVRNSEHGLGPVFILKGPWKSAYADLLRRQGIDGLRLSQSMGWNESDVQFLSELPFLRSLQIYSWDVRDCSVLSSLPELRLLCLECDLRGSIDFIPLTKLEFVLVTWAKPLEGVLNCPGVRYLNVSRWPDVDLLRLGQMTRLRELFIASRKLDSLRGVSEFPLLERLDLHACSKLATLEGIDSCVRLTSVALSACKRIGDVSVLGSLTSLRNVELDGCGELRSLTPLASLPDLERLSFNGDTRVLDGDLSFIEGLPKLRSLIFAPRGLYNRTRQALLAK